MFADFSKKEFIQTALGSVAAVIISYLTMLGVLLVL
jgi:hypothetical protein